MLFHGIYDVFAIGSKNHCIYSIFEPHLAKALVFTQSSSCCKKYFPPHNGVGFLFLILNPSRPLRLHRLIFHTHLCHTPSHTHQLCHTPSFIHNFVTHTHNLSHTTLSHTPSFTHIFVTRHLTCRRGTWGPSPSFCLALGDIDLRFA